MRDCVGEPVFCVWGEDGVGGAVGFEDLGGGEEGGVFAGVDGDAEGLGDLVDLLVAGDGVGFDVFIVVEGLGAGLFDEGWDDFMGMAVSEGEGDVVEGELCFEGFECGEEEGGDGGAVGRRMEDFRIEDEDGIEGFVFLCGAV